MNLRFIAAFVFLDLRSPGGLVASYGVIVVVAGIFLSLGVFFLGRWIWGRLTGQPFEPASGDAGSFLWKATVIGAIIWILLVAFDDKEYPRRKEGRDSSAIAQLRTINTAEVTYLSSNSGSYGNLSELITQGLLDASFANSVSGWDYSVTASGTSYTATAMPAPIKPDSFSERIYKYVDRRILGGPAPRGPFGYYSEPDAVIRYATAPSLTCNPCFPAGLSGAPIQ
jgi:hypothetical protein